MGSLLPSAEIIQPRRGFLQGRSRPLLHRGIYEPKIARQRAHFDSFLVNEIKYFARLGLYKVAPGLHPIHPPTHALDDYDAIDDVEYAYFLQTASRFNLDETAVGLLKTIPRSVAPANVPSRALGIMPIYVAASAVTGTFLCQSQDFRPFESLHVDSDCAVRPGSMLATPYP
ncbi:hypothetical protein EDD18DRAFT_1114294 [Armillaria luteobubalina]|uniref:Uncharacterized protein n=1 Tax=Armillaria luteobubalina TaxID=153913 RepID=A0AA39U9F6_9AGAR|nr:hypothetical protein EDD18DRAFT_1114294 [Armillaria luteobubalina]